MSSRQEGVEHAPDLRIEVRIPASQPFILWQLLEFPAAKHLLLVCFAELETGRIRIISASPRHEGEPTDFGLSTISITQKPSQTGLPGVPGRDRWQSCWTRTWLGYSRARSQ